MEINYPGFGTIEVAGERFDHDVVIEDGEVRARHKAPSKAFKAGTGHTPLSASEDIPWSKPRLVVGSGYSGRLPILDEVRDEAAARGVELLVLPTSEACKLLTELNEAETNAVLHVTC
jgi:hypothetical protein